MIVIDGLWIALAGIAAAVALSGMGSAIGIGLAAATAAGVMTEESKNFGKYLMLVGLPGTQGIYGFVIAFLWITKLGLHKGLASVPKISTLTGLEIFFACLPVALAGWVSAIHQGKVCAAGVALTAKKPEEAGKALVMGVFVEFYAVLGLLISLFAWMAYSF